MLHDEKSGRCRESLKTTIFWLQDDFRAPRYLWITLVLIYTVIILTFIQIRREPEPENPQSIDTRATLWSFGAKCDGVSDDSQAVLAYAAYCSEEGIPFCVPENAKLLLPFFIRFCNLKTIQMRGTIVAPQGVEFRANSKRTGNIWYFNRVEGVLRLTGLKSSDITVQSADSLSIFADSSDSQISSVAYNKFQLGYVKKLVLIGKESGWINENFFYGGRIKNLLFADGGEYPHNHNHFYDSTFENATIEFYCGRSNYIHDARFEGNINVTFHKHASNNYVHQSATGTHVPGTMFLPEWWHDESHNNYYYYGVISPVNMYEKVLTADSNNYNANQIFPYNGKLHSEGFAKLIETNLIPIEHSIGVLVESDTKFFRGALFLYDADGNQIVTEPECPPVSGRPVKWKQNCYVFGEADQDRAFFSLSRYSVIDGTDTGVAFVKIVLTGYSAADFDYLRFTVMVPWYVTLNLFKENGLVASSIPVEGEWQEGTVCRNIGDGKPNAWVYRNGTWSTAF